MRYVEPSYEDEYFPEDEPMDEVGLPEILLALDDLTERQRFVIECRYGLRPGMNGERISQSEIADLMGVTQQTVHEHEQTALQRLRTLLTTPTSREVFT